MKNSEANKIFRKKHPSGKIERFLIDGKVYFWVKYFKNSSPYQYTGGTYNSILLSSGIIK